MKLVFQTVPELNRWAELMSRDWQHALGRGAPDRLAPDAPGPPVAGDGDRAIAPP